MRLKVRDNLAEVERDLDRLAERIRTTAIPRALNALIGSAQSAGFRSIAQTYQIPARTMEQYASQRLASAADLQASITVKGRGFPLSTFNPVQGPRGVTVTIKGRRVLIPHAFMTPKFGTHVFARGAYASKAKGIRPTGQSFGRFDFGKTRLPISELYSFAPPDAFDNPATVAAMEDDTAERAPVQLRRELGAVARGY
jgi:hypothetical protein